MAGDTPAEAVQAFVEPIQRALSCFLTGKVTADSYDPDTEGVLTLNNGELVRLSMTKERYETFMVSIDVSMRYRIVQHPDPDKGPWKCTTAGWMYHLYGEKDRMTVGYHWHPISDSHVTTPHLHLPAAGECHYPTGRILIEDVLTVAGEQGAEPRDKERWEKVSADNRAAFERGATWGHSPK